MREKRSWYRTDAPMAKYFCDRCGYEWMSPEANASEYCPNCYKKDVRKRSALLSAERAVLKKERHLRKNALKAFENTKERGYELWMTNQGAIEVVFFLILLAIVIKVSFNFLLEWMS